MNVWGLRLYKKIPYLGYVNYSLRKIQYSESDDYLQLKKNSIFLLRELKTKLQKKLSSKVLIP